MVRRFLIFFLLGLGLAGCDEAVVPLVEADRFFSLYGVVNPRADSQSIVVFPIATRLQPLANEPLDARFTSTNLDDGETRVWQDSVLIRNGEAVHVFWAPFRADYGHTYRLHVERSDGAMSRVEVQVPPFAELEILPADPSSPPVQVVRVTAPVARLNRLEVTYHIRARVPPAAFSLGPVVDQSDRPDHTFPTDEPDPDDDGLVEQRGEAIFNYSEEALHSPDGWRIPILLSRDYREIRDAVRRRGNYDLDFGIRLDTLEIRMVAANAAWAPPNDTFDPEVLVQPGTLTNVSQGFGFVGAGYPLNTMWLPNADALRVAGFTIPPP